MKVRLPSLLSYQRQLVSYLEDPEVKYVTFLKSRQTGGSYLNKWLVLRWGLETGENKIGYITPTYKLSRLFFREIVQSSRLLIKSDNKSDLLIEFKSGSTVQFFSGESGDTLRGFQFTHLIIDEAAFIKDQMYQEVIHATHLIKGKKVMMCSTPFFQGGFFHQHYNGGVEEREGMKSMKVDIYQNPFVSEEEIQRIRETLPERVFRQEYMAEFLDSTGAVFKNFRECIQRGEPRKDGDKYAGIDWARSQDYTVITVMNQWGEVLEIKRVNKLDYTHQVKVISEVLDTWKPKITISEENNAGQAINEMLEKKYKGPLTRTTLNHSDKEAMIDNLVVAFEQNKITIPDDPILLNELSVFTQTWNNATKKIFYGAPSGFHDDCVISLAYAYKAMSSKKGTYNITFI